MAKLQGGCFPKKFIVAMVMPNELTFNSDMDSVSSTEIQFIGVLSSVVVDHYHFFYHSRGLGLRGGLGEERGEEDVNVLG